MKKEMNRMEAQSKAEAYCSVAERCRLDVVGKLYQWGVEESCLTEIVSHLEKEGFINSLRYAKAFVRDKYRFNQWGRVKILQALKMKQIASFEINRALEEIDEKEYEKILDALLVKKLGSIKSGTDFERKGKLIRFALGHGFEMDTILCRIKLLKLEDETFD